MSSWEGMSHGSIKELDLRLRGRNIPSLFESRWAQSLGSGGPGEFMVVTSFLPFENTSEARGKASLIQNTEVWAQVWALGL